MHASYFFKRVSAYLADQVEGDAYARWTEGDLYASFQWALSFLATVKPEWFIKKFTIPLVEGARQTLPLGCVRVMETEDNLRPITRSSLRLVDPSRNRAFVGRDREEFKLTEYSYDGEVYPEVVFVQPPVPPFAVGKPFSFEGVYKPIFSAYPEGAEEDFRVSFASDSIIESLMVYYISLGENESASLKVTGKQRFDEVCLLLKIAPPQEVKVDTPKP